MNILAVDDSTTNNVLLEAVLNIHGYNTFIAENARNADKVLEEENIDLILLDLLMPGIDGFQFLESLGDKGKGDIPVLVISAANQQENIKKAKDLGAVGFIDKPIDLDILIQKIDQLFKN
ncbi:MAG: response regulator [Bacteroidota bacterium]